MPRFQTQPTPNPNSLKITSDGLLFIEEGMESFGSAAEAAEHPLGRRLFAIEGIANVFVLPAFLTLTKTPDTDWSEILPAAEETLSAYFAEREG
ncbi:MAG: NifU N-terminal domain-containing protein [Rhodothermales bacterium]